MKIDTKKKKRFCIAYTNLVCLPNPTFHTQPTWLKRIPLPLLYFQIVPTKLLCLVCCHYFVVRYLFLHVESCFSKHGLSSLQLETVQMVGMRHSKPLADGVTTAGYFMYILSFILNISYSFIVAMVRVLGKGAR